MTHPLKRIHIQNYRSLVNVDIELGGINLLFGSNGAGKSSFLDVLWFIHECAVRDVNFAAQQRTQTLSLNAGSGVIEITLEMERLKYHFDFVVTEQIRPDELVKTIPENLRVIDRRNNTAFFRIKRTEEPTPVLLREPEKLSISHYLYLDNDFPEVEELSTLLHRIQVYRCRNFNFSRIKNGASEMSREVVLDVDGQNLWSVLRNVEGRRNTDARYTTIMDYMRKAFPRFDGVVIEPIGNNSLYASFQERDVRGDIRASNAPDGYIQMLLILTALFAQPQEWNCILLMDEPDLSLHPWALAVFGEACRHAAEEWNRQILLTTHSPVLMSQFEPQDILVVELQEGKTTLQRLSEKTEMQDLLEEYALGALYMAQAVAPQSTDRN